MSTFLMLASKCSRCAGTGIEDAVSDGQGGFNSGTCSKCQGTGYLESGKIDVTEIMSDLDKCKKRLKKIMDNLSIVD